MKEIDIKFSEQERALILDYTFADTYLTDRLKFADIKGKFLVAKFSYCDLDGLMGFIAAEANHADDKKIGKQLDKLFSRLSDILDSKFID